jgi:hypothetical protein
MRRHASRADGRADLTITLPPGRLAELLRRAATGDLLPPATVEFGRGRRLDAPAFVLPGTGRIEDYLAALSGATAEFAAWDGRIAVVERDGVAPHRVVIVDRYGQVYEAADAEDAAALPTVAALEQWFRFLATACPVCGVLDDPRPWVWTP